VYKLSYLLIYKGVITETGITVDFHYLHFSVFLVKI